MKCPIVEQMAPQEDAGDGQVAHDCPRRFEWKESDHHWSWRLWKCAQKMMEPCTLSVSVTSGGRTKA